MTGAKTSIAARIRSSEPAGGIRLFEMNTSIDDVVTIIGSLLGGPAFNPVDNRETAQMMAAMLDQAQRARISLPSVRSWRK